ncbi:MAG: hypothetical protein AAF745_18680, partial [Planctomycetota bacterium]
MHSLRFFKHSSRTALWTFVLLVLVPNSAHAEPPNIVFILADDHTTQAISCYGGPLAQFARTEHIDRL